MSRSGQELCYEQMSVHMRACSCTCVRVRASESRRRSYFKGGGVEVGHKERSEEGPEVTRREGDVL